MAVYSSRVRYRACMHDPKVFTDPHEFRPKSSFMKLGVVGERDPTPFVFGYGWRFVHYSSSRV